MKASASNLKGLLVGFVLAVGLSGCMVINARTYWGPSLQPKTTASVEWIMPPLRPRGNYFAIVVTPANNDCDCGDLAGCSASIRVRDSQGNEVFQNRYPFDDRFRFHRDGPRRSTLRLDPVAGLKFGEYYTFNLSIDGCDSGKGACCIYTLVMGESYE